MNSVEDRIKKLEETQQEVIAAIDTLFSINEKIASELNNKMDKSLLHF